MNDYREEEKKQKEDKGDSTLAALVRRSPLSPTEMLRTSFWTFISLIGFDCFFSDAYHHPSLPTNLITNYSQRNKKPPKKKKHKENNQRRSDGDGGIPLLSLWRRRRSDNWGRRWEKTARNPKMGRSRRWRIRVYGLPDGLVLLFNWAWLAGKRLLSGPACVGPLGFSWKKFSDSCLATIRCPRF